jgi:hypothetical protein
MKFPVTLSHAADHEVRVTWQLSDLSATGATKAANGVDYKRGTAKTLIFKPAAGTGRTPTVKVVSVTLYGDTNIDGDEELRITLSNPTGGYELGRGLGTGTIVDDEAAGPGPRLAIGDLTFVRAADGTQTAIVPITMSGPVNTRVTVPYTVTSGDATWTAKATGGDFGGKVNGNLILSANVVTKSINVKLWPGASPETAKHITITLGTPSDPSVTVTRGTGTLTIL